LDATLINAPTEWLNDLTANDTSPPKRQRQILGFVLLVDQRVDSPQRRLEAAREAQAATKTETSAPSPRTAAREER